MYIKKLRDMKLDIKIKFQNGYDAITKKDNKADGEKNDCVVRALMNAFEISYNKAHKIAEQDFGRQKGKGTQGTYNTLMRMVDGDIDTPNFKEIKYIGSHPKAGGKKTLRNPLYPIVEKKFNDEGEEVKESTFAGYTIGKFIQQKQKGTFIVLVAGHALAVKDGVMIDNGNYNDDLLIMQRRDQRRCQHIFQVK
tara:strand:- start:90 stop:671 length:582 start_codon:yes stop_codon:yes gene_type:complete